MDKFETKEDIGDFFLSISNRLESIADVIQHLSDFAERHQITDKILAILCMAVDELLSNTIKYGYPENLNDTIRISGILEENNLRLIIEDQASPFNPLLQAQRGTPLSIDDEEVGGRGIQLVLTMVNQVEYDYREGKNIMTLTMTA